MKLNFTLLFIFILFGATSFSQIHIEAETGTQSSGTANIKCQEGGNALGFMADYRWADYPVTLPADSIYKLSIRIAGSGGDIWILDTTWNVLGKISYTGTFTDQSYVTVSTCLFLKANAGKLRIQAKNNRCNINWFEIATTGLLACNYFESDWEYFTTATGNLPWKSSYADSLYGYRWPDGSRHWIRQVAISGSLTISNEQFGSGTRGHARFNLSKSDVSTWPYVRSEIYGGPFPEPEMWLGFSTNSPTNISGDGLAHTFMQIHATDDPTESARSPFFGFYVERDSIFAKILRDADSLNTNATKDGEQAYNLGKFVAGQWDRWVVYYKFAWDATGYIDIYRNGLLVMSRHNQPNCYNDKKRGYLKFGIYKWGWDGWASYSPFDTIVYYIDDIKIGGVHSGYVEVESID